MRGIRTSLYALLGPVLLSIPGYAVARGFHLNVGLLSLDVLAASCLVLRARAPLLRAFAFASVIAILLLDLAIFLPPGVSVADVFETGIRSAASIGAWKLLAVCVLTVASIGIGLGALQLAATKSHATLSIAVLGAVITAGIVQAASVTLGFINSKDFRSAGFGAMKLLASDPGSFLVKLSLREEALASDAKLSSIETDAKSASKLLVILVESWGMPTHNGKETIAREVSTLLQDSCKRDLRISKISTGNYTIQSEVRQLCSAEMHTFKADVSSLACLPRAVHSPSFAYHNNTLDFYRRNVVYKQMGFHAIYGRAEMALSPGPGIPFDGASDESVASFIQANARSNPGLHYWMTLNMHGPYGAQARRLAGSDLENYWSLRRHTLATLASLVSNLPDYQFIVMGDHSPRFFGGEDTEFEKNIVPLVTLASCSNDGGSPAP